jgi:hypothetical protein
MHPSRHTRSLLAATLLLSGAAEASTITLYDGNLGNLPQDQGWLDYQPYFPPVIVPNLPAPVAGGLTLDTQGTAGGAAGFTSHRSVPPLATVALNPSWPLLELDPAEGFRLSFELQIFDENHTSPDRAGFSAILLGQDNLGIELGFWANGIWAQSGPAFNRAEGASFTATDRVLYDLTVLGMGYWLRVDGLDILSGAIRDYSPASPTPDPYGIGSFVFLGDNTGSADARFFLGTVTLTNGLQVPSPPGWALLVGGLALGHLGRRRHRPQELERDNTTT